MQGRTKGIFEDFFVLLVIVVLGYGGFVFFFSEEKVTVSNTTLVQKDTNEQDTQVSIEDTQSTTNKKPTHTTNIQEIKTADTQENLASQEVLENLGQNLENVTENVKKNNKSNYKDVTKSKITEKIIKNDTNVSSETVDINKLNDFLKKTKKKVKDSIALNVKNNKLNYKISIRLTVLRNGQLEKIEYISGERELYENNHSNIASIFPVNIDENIAGDFPRYLRYSFEFSVKDE